jgi:hypothetical protein
MEYLIKNDYGQAKISWNRVANPEPGSETYFTIKHLAEFSGIKPHTIRTWEQRFAFLNPQRTETSRRVYLPGQVTFFLEVCLLKQNGYRMSRIAKMNTNEKIAIIYGIGGSQKYTRKVHELICSMAAMDSIRFNSILDECVGQYGIHETITLVLLPFCERTGVFDNPEKKPYKQNIFLVMECIKQKIYLAIESVPPVIGAAKSQTVLLFPSGSSTELPLLYLYYFIKKEGFKIIYPGKYFSFKELSAICSNKRPDCIVTHFPRSFNYSDPGDLVKSSPCYIPVTDFIPAARSLPFDKHVYYYKRADDFTDITASLDLFTPVNGR